MRSARVSARFSQDVLPLALDHIKVSLHCYLEASKALILVTSCHQLSWLTADLGAHADLMTVIGNLIRRAEPAVVQVGVVDVCLTMSPAHRCY
jgi:hypothetical protein